MAKGFLVDLNLNQNELQNAVLQNLASDPSTPYPGQTYFNTTTNRFRVYNGTSWDEMGTGGGTVTSITAQNATDGGLSIKGSPITTTGTLILGHSNILASAQTTEGIYPIKYDKNGHITSAGAAFDPDTKQDKLDTQTAYTSVGSSSKIPQITTNSLGQVTEINEIAVDIPVAGTSVSAVSTTSSVGSAATYAKSDHVHNIESKTITSALGYTPYNATNPNGYTSNEGTITGVSVNGTSVATKGVANITTIPASIISVGELANGMTAATQSAGDNSTKIATTGYVDTAIDNLPEPMVFKGSLGTNGTITTLPAAATSNTGHTYKVITAGTYASQSAKIGDTFISDGSAWILIPSGDEPSGTVTSVSLTDKGGLTISGSPITSSGTISIGHSNSVTAQSTQAIYPIAIDSYGHISSYGTAVTLLKKHTASITGDGNSTSFKITHGLSSRDVIVQVYDSSTYEEVIVDIIRTDANNVTIEFSNAITSGKSYSVVIIG